MDKIEQLDRILIDYNLGNIKRHKAREKICLLFDVVGQSEQLSRCEHKGKKWIPQIAETYCPMCREIL